MKKYLFAFLAAVLVATLVIFPASAAECGTTYTVQPKDNLTKIATLCNTTVDEILKRNPEITNPNVVRVGQVIRISGSFYFPIGTPSNSSTTTDRTGNARVTLSTTRAREGDKVTVYVTGFPANAWIDYRVGQQGKDYSLVYDGTVNSRGAASQDIYLPADADVGEYWVVVVTTTSQARGVEVTSHTIQITN